MEEHSDIKARKDLATKHLRTAIDKLRKLAGEQPDDAAIASSLADAIDDYTRIADADLAQKDQLLEEARAIRQRIAEAKPEDLERQVLWFEAEAISAAAAGQKKGLVRYKAFLAIKDSLASKWPSDMEGACRCASFWKGDKVRVLRAI